MKTGAHQAFFLPHFPPVQSWVQREVARGVALCQSRLGLASRGPSLPGQLLPQEGGLSSPPHPAGRCLQPQILTVERMGGRQIIPSDHRGVYPSLSITPSQLLPLFKA
ncbi:unnamed protein product [Rangifer tarandus platyrhynchus]|uniref:Uncharacterized protein n=2 Tax=Rangifer tarandus platyrhynchus TaxID=3082113 RepID=A0ABN8YQ60_RANTA|nr:unnamed protein product [Rangifer tarandus platyrhynchus]